MQYLKGKWPRAPRLIPLTQACLRGGTLEGARSRESRIDGAWADARGVQKEFADEGHCAAFLQARRWPDGFVCPVCGKGRAVALKSRPRLFECLDCGRQTSLTAGTAMHRSKLPLTTWFWAAHVMATHSNGMSARQLEDQLGRRHLQDGLAADAEAPTLDDRSRP